MTDPTTITLTATILTILVALVGYVVKYYNDLLMQQRQQQLEKVNKQINEFYGPLFALNEAGKASKDYFDSYVGWDHFWRGEKRPLAEDAANWRLWMTEVWMPLNIRMEDIIFKNLALLDGPMPECFKNLSAHIATYKPMLKMWEDQVRTNNTDWLKVARFEDHVCRKNFPGEELDEFLSTRYEDRLKRQKEIIGEKADTVPAISGLRKSLGAIKSKYSELHND